MPSEYETPTPVPGQEVHYEHILFLDIDVSTAIRWARVHARDLVQAIDPTAYPDERTYYQADGSLLVFVTAPGVQTREFVYPPEGWRYLTEEEMAIEAQARANLDSDPYDHLEPPLSGKSSSGSGAAN